MVSWAVNILGMFAGAGSHDLILTHRQHHVHSDTELDPYRSVKGIWAVYVNTWGYGFKIKRRFIKRLLQDKVLRWFHKYYFHLNVAIIVVFTLLIPLFMIFGYAMPVVLAFMDMEYLMY